MGKRLERLTASVMGRFAAKYAADRADDGAVLIAWTALFSLFPLLIGLLAIFGMVMGDPERLQAVTTTIQTQFPAEFSELLGFLDETRELSGLLGVVSVLLLLWSGSALFGAMASVFNRFYAAPDRSFVSQRLMSFVMIGVYILLLLAAVITSGVPTLLIAFSEQILPLDSTVLAAVIGWFLSIGTAVIVFIVLYRLVPNVSLRTRDVWRGSLLAGVLFVILSQIFPLYLRLFGGGFAAYRTLGLFLLLMTWFYLLARIIVLGAELNAFVAGRSAASTREPAAEPGGV